MPDLAFAPHPSCQQAPLAALRIDSSYPDLDTVVLTPAGEADLYTVPTLRQALSEAVGAGRLHVIVDLDGLAFMDASTLGALVAARQRICATGGTLHVRCTTRRGLRLMSIAGLKGMLVHERGVTASTAADPASPTFMVPRPR